MPVSMLKKFGLKFSLNDPHWGRGSQNDDQKPQEPSQPPRPPENNRRPNTDGPPDLDQLWRDFNQRINRLLGKKGGGGNNGGSNNGGGDGFRPDMRGAGIGAAVVGGIVGVLWLASGFYIVQEGSNGVVMTFGKYSHMTQAGVNWHWPYPVQSSEIVNVSQVRTAEIGYRSTVKNKQPKEALMLTDDENIIDIQFAVQYRLKNAAEWVFNNRDQDETVRQVAETAIREIVGKSKMDFVLYEGREKVALDVTQLMQVILDRYKMGAIITNVTMQGVQPPEQVQASFDDAVKAGQDRERLKNEGQAYANDVVPKARGTAARLNEESAGYSARVVANAEGEAARFKQVLTEYQKAPGVTRDRLYLDAMQQIFTSTSKVMVDTRNNNSMIYLPLDKLISQSAGGSGAAGAATSDPNARGNLPATIATPLDPVQATDPTPRPTDARSRDSRNPRDREVR
jgi:membrane protease subunit HflK